MKNKLMLVIITISLFLMPIIVNAEDKIEINCPKSKIKMGEKLTCTINGNSENPIIGVDATVSVSGNLEIVSIEKNSAWDGETENNRLLLYWSNVDKKDVVFGKVTVKAVRNYKNADGKILVIKSNGSTTKGIELATVNGASIVDNVEQLITIKGGKTSSNNTAYVTFGIAAVVVIIIVVVIALKNKKKK